MRFIFTICFTLLLFSEVFSQQTVKGKYFDIIISLSASGTDNRVEKIKNFISTDATGLIYEGYCKSQKCIILKASTLSFGSSDAVVAYLKLHIGDAILAHKDYTVKEFYRLCTFASDEEYYYFKTTYR